MKKILLLFFLLLIGCSKSDNPVANTPPAFSMVGNWAIPLSNDFVHFTITTDSANTDTTHVVYGHARQHTIIVGARYKTVASLIFIDTTSGNGIVFNGEKKSDNLFDGNYAYSISGSLGSYDSTVIVRE